MAMEAALMPRLVRNCNTYSCLIRVYHYFKAVILQGLMRKSGWLSWIWLWLDGEVERWWFSWRKTNQKVKFYYFEKALLMLFKLEFVIKIRSRTVGGNEEEPIFERLSLQEIEYGSNKKEVGGLC
jgi:hypothetical protein